MDLALDDSLFESSGEEEKRVDASQVKYEAKRCELNWFTDPGLDSEDDFMLAKYRGDLFYLQRNYRAAVACYEAALRATPPGKSVVVRELTESVARCRLNLKQPREGLERAYQLVAPPHEKDSSAWKLIADCQGALGQTTAQVISLQKCVLTQRHQFSYWTSLGTAYTLLSEHYSRETLEWTQVHSIMDTTVTLFRPYFSWIPLYNKANSTTSQCAPTDSCCTKSCSLNNNSRAYTDVAVSEGVSLCLAHLPFPVLCSGCVSVTEAVTKMRDHPGSAQELVCSFLHMAERACLLWARQLLLYFVRYSHSFVTPSHQRALSQVDQLLLTGDQATRLFLETYFNKNRIFEESQSKE